MRRCAGQRPAFRVIARSSNAPAGFVGWREHFELLALAQRHPPALPGSVKELYSEKDLLVEQSCGRPTATIKNQEVFLRERKGHSEPTAHHMEVPVSCSVCTEMPSDGNIRANQKDIGQILNSVYTSDMV